MFSARVGQDPHSINDLRINNYLHLVGLVILLWDHALTLSMEIKYIWKPSARLTGSLFLLNRYFTLLANVIYSVSLFNESPFTPSSCEAFFIFREVSLLLTESTVSFLLILRIYAIYECSVRVLVFLLSFGAVLIGLVLFALIYSPPSDTIVLTPLGCHSNLDSLIPHSLQGAAAWEALFVYDCLLFAMVVFKGYNTRRHLHGRRVPLLEMVLRDGAIYFAVMALSNLANIFTFYFAGPFTRGSLSTFSTAISVTLISRLTLNLRANASVEQLPRSRTQSDSLRLRFASALTSTLGSRRRYQHHSETSPSRQLQLTDLSQSTYASASLQSANACTSTSATLLTPIEVDAGADEGCSDHGHGHDPNTLGREG